MTNTGPLHGVRILDYTTTFSGPFCTQILVELGADVIKVETPSGDITRQLGEAPTAGLASIFVAINRGKSSVALDLKQPADQRIMHQLVERADCVVHNMRLGAAQRIGIDPETIHRLNPRAIHAAITGYGSTGPYADVPAYDDTIQAASGLAALQTSSAHAPSYIATAVADKVAGMAAVNAILAALYWRERTGQGQAVEIPMFETTVAFTIMEQWGGLAFLPPAGSSGYARLRSPYRRPYETTDGYVSVVVYHEGHWKRFLQFIGREEMLETEEFATVQARTRNIDTLYALVESEIAKRSTDDWIRIFSEIDIPAMKVNTIDDLLNDTHLNAVRFFQEVDGGPDGTIKAARSPFLFSHTATREPVDIGPPQRLNAGKDAIERWLGEDNADRSI